MTVEDSESVESDGSIQSCANLNNVFDKKPDVKVVKIEEKNKREAVVEANKKEGFTRTWFDDISSSDELDDDLLKYAPQAITKA